MRRTIGLVLVLLFAVAVAGGWWLLDQGAAAARGPLHPGPEIAELVAAAPGWADGASAVEATPRERGAYLLAAGGCASCHTADGGDALAGGVALDSPFGTFYAPNITPDAEHGIGGWTFADFERAMRRGRAPDGTAYFPAFPYTAYAAITDADLADLWLAVRAADPSPTPNRPHEVPPPFGWHALLPIWQAVFLEEGTLAFPADVPAAFARGAYLTEALAHCGECHTPRGPLGGLDRTRAFAGGRLGDRTMPAVDAEALADWSVGDIAFMLSIGMLPDGDFVGGDMAKVVENTTGPMTAADREAIAVYLKGLVTR